MLLGSRRPPVFRPVSNHQDFSGFYFYLLPTVQEMGEDEDRGHCQACAKHHLLLLLSFLWGSDRVISVQSQQRWCSPKNPGIFLIVSWSSPRGHGLWPGDPAALGTQSAHSLHKCLPYRPFRSWAFYRLARDFSVIPPRKNSFA